MAVAVDDHVAAGEELPQALSPAVRRPTVVDEPDPNALELGAGTHGQEPPQLPVVHVALHRRHRREALEIGEHGGRGEVTRVHDRVGCLEDPQALDRKRARAAREVRVSEQRDQKRSGRNSPFR